MLDDADLRRYLRTSDDCGYRALRILDYPFECLDFAFHQVAEHLVIREILGDKSCRSMSTVCSAECIIDIAVSV